MDTLNLFETQILDWVRDNLSNNILDTIMPILTAFANAGIGWILMAVVLLFFKRTRAVGISMGIALVMGLIIGNMTLKPLIARTRPYDFNPDIVLLVSKPSDYSFPSGHTLASFESATTILLYHKKWGIAAMALAFVIAFSRIYLYIHYPSDVLAGTVLGVIIGIVAVQLFKWINRRQQLKNGCEG